MNGWTLYITAFSMGLISSLHCVVMCGPLSMAMPVKSLSAAGRISAFLHYHFGRAITYSLLGILVGMLGHRARFFGWQQSLSMLTGIVLLVMLIQKYSPFAKTKKKSAGYYNIIYRLISRISHIKGNAGFLLFGAANGLLPCGMVYFALVTAINAPGMMQSILFMFLFGTGTFPAMLALNLTSQSLSFGWKLKVQKFVPWFICLIAVLLIVRGMNLGLPYLSPYHYSSETQAVLCPH